MKKGSIKTKILLIVVLLIVLSLGSVAATFGISMANTTQDTIEEILSETGTTAALAVQNRLIATKNVLQEIGTVARLSNVESSVADKAKILKDKQAQYGFTSL
ncbi:MAG: hypothetical protein RR902_06495, partial [Oscillospiraceae bacterium]